MLITPPLFCSPAPGEKLRVLDLVQFQSPAEDRARRFVEEKCRYLETTPGVEHRVVTPGANAGEDCWAASRVHTLAAPRWPGAEGARVLCDRAGVRRIAAEFRSAVSSISRV